MKKVFLSIVFVLLLSLQALAAESASSPGRDNTLRIISAKYGAGQQWMDVTDAVSGKVAETGSFHIPAGASNCASAFGKDPVPNVKKSVVIVYSYSGEEPGMVHTLVQLEDNEIRIPAAKTNTPEAPRPPASAADAQPNKTNAANTFALYEKYKCKYMYIDGEYIRLPDFDLMYENSRRGARLPEAAKYRTVITHNTRQVTRRSGGNAVTVIPGDRKHKATVVNDVPYETVYEDEEVPVREWLPQDAIDDLERAWKTELPALAVGAFGVWPDAERIAVVHILGPDDVILACNETSFRLKGVNTAGLQAGDNMLMSTLTVFSYTVTGPRSIRELEVAKDNTKTVTGYNTKTGRTAGHEATTERESRIEKQYVEQDVTVTDVGPKFSIAIIAKRSIPGFSTAPILLAIPTERVREGLTMEQFADMLRSGVDPGRQDESARPLIVIKEADDDQRPAAETQKK